MHKCNTVGITDYLDPKLTNPMMSHWSTGLEGVGGQLCISVILLSLGITLVRN